MGLTVRCGLILERCPYGGLSRVRSHAPFKSHPVIVFRHSPEPAQAPGNRGDTRLFRPVSLWGFSLCLLCAHCPFCGADPEAPTAGNQPGAKRRRNI